MWLVSMRINNNLQLQKPYFLLYHKSRIACNIFPEKGKKSSYRKCSTNFYLLLQAETLVETIDTSTGVNQLLLAGIERVALGADFNTNLLLSGTGLENVTTSATNRGLFVLRMDTLLHFVHLFLLR